MSHVAIVSGAGGEIGREVAIYFAGQGYDLILISKTSTQLEHTKTYCLEENPTVKIRTIVHDATQETIKDEIAQAVESLGGVVHVLVNLIGTLTFGLLQKISSSTLKEEVLSTYLANVFVTQATIPFMKNCGAGAIIFLTTLFNQFFVGIPGLANYQASKAALDQFAKCVFEEVRIFKVRVTTIAPGIINCGLGIAVKHGLNTAYDREQGLPMYCDISPDDMIQINDVVESIKYVVDGMGSAGCPGIILLQPQKQMNAELQRYNELKALPQTPVPITHPDREVAFITGASKGIGRDIAIRLAKNGFHLGLLARSKPLLDETAALCKDANPLIEVTTFYVDVTDLDALENAVHETVKRLGNLTVVISNAGVNRRRSAITSSRAVWDQVMDTNLRSSMNVVRTALIYLCHNRRGSVIFVGSAVVLHTGMAGSTPYFASKWGMAGFANALFEDVRPFGVKICSLLPGLVNTEMGTKEGPVKYFAPSDLIQSSDISDATLYVIRSSPTVCPVRIVFHPQRGSSPLTELLINKLRAQL